MPIAKRLQERKRRKKIENGGWARGGRREGGPKVAEGKPSQAVFFSTHQTNKASILASGKAGKNSKKKIEYPSGTKSDQSPKLKRVAG